MKVAPLALGIALTAAACSKGAPSDCQRAVHHVLVDLMAPPRGAPPPSEQEAEVIRQVEAMSVATCEREGLGAAQLACILAARTAEDFPALLRCPAIVEQRPSWLIGGP
jgi:hypothetical protein